MASAELSSLTCKTLFFDFHLAIRISVKDHQISPETNRTSILCHNDQLSAFKCGLGVGVEELVNSFGMRKSGEYRALEKAC
jgi:hypothetical protein